MDHQCNAHLAQDYFLLHYIHVAVTDCEARQHKGRRQKPLTLFGAEYLLPPFRQGAGVGATFAPMSLFNNKTQNILALMHDFYCIL